MASENGYSSGMVVIAHADDAEYGCSGTIAKLCAEGWEMTYVLCTDGSKGSSDREITGEELAAIRQRRADQRRQGAGAERRGVPGIPGRLSRAYPGCASRHCSGDSQVQARRRDLPVSPASSRWRLGCRPSRPPCGWRGGSRGRVSDRERPHDLP